MSKKRHVQESCSCGGGIVAKHKQVLKWRKEHLHSEVRDVHSATQVADADYPEEEYEDFKMGFQLSTPATPTPEHDRLF